MILFPHFFWVWLQQVNIISIIYVNDLSLQTIKTNKISLSEKAIKCFQT